MDEPNPRHVALHEAAHAVVALQLGVPVARVTVRPTAHSLGGVTLEEAPTGRVGALVSLAGAAMNYELGLLSGTGCDKDAFDATRALSSTEEFDSAFHEALILVRTNTGTIERVADELLLEGTIETDRLRQLVPTQR